MGRHGTQRSPRRDALGSQHRRPGRRAIQITAPHPSATDGMHHNGLSGCLTSRIPVVRAEGADLLCEESDRDEALVDTTHEIGRNFSLQAAEPHPTTMPWETSNSSSPRPHPRAMSATFSLPIPPLAPSAHDDQAAREGRWAGRESVLFSGIMRPSSIVGTMGSCAVTSQPNSSSTSSTVRVSICRWRLRVRTSL